MPKPIGRKGFVVSSPLVGAVIFMTAAVVAVVIVTENDALISMGRASETNDKLEFMTQAIQADSYDVLLQQKLEVMTLDFLQNGYFNIESEEGWKQSFKSSMLNYFTEKMGWNLGLDLAAYKAAYENIPGMVSCEVIAANETVSNADIYDSDLNDGTLRAKAFSFGQRIRCVSADPVGDVTVDIGGRFYRINARAPLLYGLAKKVITASRTALNGGMESIPEPKAVWEAPKWAIVSKIDNKLVKVSEVQLEAIADAWINLMKGWFEARIMDVAKGYFTADGVVGVSLKDFEVVPEKGDVFNLSDMEVSCVEDHVGSLRNCMPFRVDISLGDISCSGREPPKNSKNPFYDIKSMKVTCGGRPCSAVSKEITDLIEPMKSLCIGYYQDVDSVYPVCKKWEGKARSVIHRGILTDDNSDYTVAASNETAFKFMDEHPDVWVTSITDDRLKCDGQAGQGKFSKEDDDRYTANVMRLLQNLEVTIGRVEGATGSAAGWADKGSALSQVQDPNLNDIYKSIYGQGVMPIPCILTGGKPGEKCYGAGSQEDPRIEINLDWKGARESCINGINNLCDAYCNGAAKQEGTDAFCKSMFPEGSIGGGKGLLKCTCGETYVQIDSLSIAVGQV